jgi:alpha-mannosidase
LKQGSLLQLKKWFWSNSKTGIVLKIIKHIIVSIILFACANAQETVPLSSEGYIPVWSVAGPFEQPMVGFGVPVDEDIINEKNVIVHAGKTEKSSLVKDGVVEWVPQSIAADGFLDFNQTLRWNKPGISPKKIWYAITGYAVSYIHSDTDQNAVIKFGSNSFGKILVNGSPVFDVQHSRNAIRDENSVDVNLKKGENIIVVKTGNSHKNHGLSFFGELKWEWGFYLRLTDKAGNPVKNVHSTLPAVESADFNVVSTFFFKKINGVLSQRIDIELISPYFEKSVAELNLNNTGYEFEGVNYGLNRFSVFIPEVISDTKAEAIVKLKDKITKKEVTLLPAKHYEVYVMMLSHTDIGYTHPQPVVKEIHNSTLDDVVVMCREYPDFKWTIETLWQLEQYEQSRTPEQFNSLVEFIKSGRIAVSPLYTNPFTGWTGEEEMIRSLDKAKYFKNKYGLEYNAAVYNDIPGQSWLLPQLLNNAGVKFLAEGLNEIFNDYSFQRSLPKAFIWEGSDGSKILTYRNEGYNEGRDYGLEGRGNYTVQQRLWEILNKSAGQGYDYEMVLLNAAFMDNSIVPKDQFFGIEKWNSEYEYPKFISSHLSEFAALFIEKYGNSLPELRGDWTSSWDSHSQGEAERMRKQRLIQHSLLSAEKMSTLTALLGNKNSSFSEYINEAYNSILNFSGHGSGLEYGYGSPSENLITMDFRQNYIDDAFMKTEEVLLRGLHRFIMDQQSFDKEGIIVFNTLSWERDAPVEVQFPAESNQEYNVVDLVTGEGVLSFRKGHKLYFVARNLPPLGFRKYALKPVTRANGQKAAGLSSSAASIENQYYRIVSDGKSIISIIDKKSGKELIDKENLIGFNELLMKKAPDIESYSQIASGNVNITVKDESPVRFILQIERPGALFENTRYILWNDLDRVDIEHTVNASVMDSTEKLEQYGIAFPFAVADKEILLELSGGFLDPVKERLPGASTDVFSIRRSAALFNKEQNISISSMDARVIEITGSDKNPVLVSNVLNNFPLNWNRYESHSGEILFRYSFTSQPGSFNPSYTSLFGWELNTSPLVKRSWYREQPVSGSYMNISNNEIILLALPYNDREESFLLRLMNANGSKINAALIKSYLFSGYNAFLVNYLEEDARSLQVSDNSVRVSLRPNEIQTIKFIKETKK